MGQDELLVAVIDRIMPGDRDPGALALGTEQFVRRQLAEDTTDGALIGQGLAQLAASLPDFPALGPAERDRGLEAVENTAWFARLVVLVAEGFYADPDNGGNAGAASWAMIGYAPRLPEGPSGPAAQTRAT